MWGQAGVCCQPVHQDGRMKPVSRVDHHHPRPLHMARGGAADNVSRIVCCQRHLVPERHPGGRLHRIPILISTINTFRQI